MEKTLKKTENATKTLKRPLLVGLISLGCDKNRVDSETMLSFLAKAGYRFTSDPANADILIVNTCGFIASARDESMEAIAEMVQYKNPEKGRCQRLVVTGCMPQRWSSEMREDFPEVDVFLGIDHYTEIVSILEASFAKKGKIVKLGKANTLPYIKNRVVTTPAHYAYLKIADGCDNFCTFCTIPYIRGRFRSRSVEDILEEAKDLVAGGARELILVAQDISRYGTDKSGKSELVGLIKKLSKIKDLEWIRLLYCYPEMLSDELISEIVSNDKVCKYLDIPLQHVSDKILKRMNRRSTKADIENVLTKLQNQSKFIAIRTTFMTGFPGETEADFEELCEFIKKYRLMHVGFFAYSKEDGTPAANLPDQIDDDVKRKRVLKLMKIQHKIATEVSKEFIGKTVDVCYEGIDYDKQLFFGRTQYQTPEADNLVYFRSSRPVDIGKIYKVKIKKVKGYDFLGEIEDEI